MSIRSPSAGCSRRLLVPNQWRSSFTHRCWPTRLRCGPMFGKSGKHALGLAGVALVVLATAHGCWSSGGGSCPAGPLCECSDGTDCYQGCADGNGCDLLCHNMVHCGGVCGDSCRLECHDVNDCSSSCGDNCAIDCHNTVSCGAFCGANCQYHVRQRRPLRREGRAGKHHHLQQRHDLRGRMSRRVPVSRATTPIPAS